MMDWWIRLDSAITSAPAEWVLIGVVHPVSDLYGPYITSRGPGFLKLLVVQLAWIHAESLTEYRMAQRLHSSLS